MNKGRRRGGSEMELRKSTWCKYKQRFSRGELREDVYQQLRKDKRKEEQYKRKRKGGEERGKDKREKGK